MQTPPPEPQADEPPASEPPVEPAVPEPPVVEPSPVEPALVLSNPSENTIRVGFALDGVVTWLEPGESKSFAGAGPWSIAFHRGADLGDYRETLEPAAYAFSVSPQGWTLAPAAQSVDSAPIP
jgi:hypothetical protein